MDPQQIAWRNRVVEMMFEARDEGIDPYEVLAIVAAMGYPIVDILAVAGQYEDAATEQDHQKHRAARGRKDMRNVQDAAMSESQIAKGCEDLVAGAEKFLQAVTHDGE